MIIGTLTFNEITFTVEKIREPKYTFSQKENFFYSCYIGNCAIACCLSTELEAITKAIEVIKTYPDDVKIEAADQEKTKQKGA